MYLKMYSLTKNLLPKSVFITDLEKTSFFVISTLLLSCTSIQLRYLQNLVEIYILGVPLFIHQNIYQTAKAKVFFAFTRRIILPFLYHKCAIQH